MESFVIECKSLKLGDIVLLSSMRDIKHKVVKVEKNKVWVYPNEPCNPIDREEKYFYPTIDGWESCYGCLEKMM